MPRNGNVFVTSSSTYPQPQIFKCLIPNKKQDIKISLYDSQTQFNSTHTLHDLQTQFNSTHRLHESQTQFNSTHALHDSQTQFNSTLT